MSALNGWHPGEERIREKLAFDKIPSLTYSYTMVKGEMPEQHSTFYSSNLHFLPVVTLDADSRPWTSILAGEGGEIGWVKHPRYNTLNLIPKVWEGDPLWENTKQDRSGGEDDLLIAGIGVEVSTRRRNKFAGKVTVLERDEAARRMKMDIEVNQAIGNCPKYIVLRSVEPYPASNPTISLQNLHVGQYERLPEAAISFIHAADTVWLGTAYLPSASPQTSKFPPHLGVNHRGGRPGFVRVRPSDGRTLVLPDYSGNRIMTTLGNIEHTPVASLTIADFESGDVLYLTGQAKNLVGEEAEDVMPFQSVLTTIHITGFVFVKDALPIRQQPLADKGPEGVEYSPYSPPVRPLKEELEAQGLSLFASSGSDGKPTALLKRIQIVSENIAIFTFSPSVPINHKPGQYIILDWRSFLGERQYRHMSPTSPTSLNDDFIRTWTISSFAPHDPDSSPTKANDFQLTIRYQPGGAVTSPLFTMARKIQQTRPELLDDLTSLAIRPRIPGVSGEFTLDLPRENEIQSAGVEGPRKLVWAAGGIGITPFLSMLRSIVHHSRRFPAVKWDILFLLSTREPEILVPLVIDACGASPDDLTNVTIQLPVFFTKGPDTPVVPDNTPSWLSITHHPTRVTPEWLRGSSLDFKGRELYVCGAPPYEKTIMDSLTSDEVGISKDAVKSEWFAF